MQHLTKTAFLAASAMALVAPAVLTLKSDDDDPVNVVTKALDEFKGTIDDRLKKLEEKGDATKLETRLKDLETKANRPGGGDDKKPTEPTVERKAFGTYLRHGNATPAEELKALTVSSDPSGGYLAPAEMSNEMIRDLVEFSPIRAVASVRSTGAPSVLYPKRTSGTAAKWKGETQPQEESSVGFGQAEIVTKELTTFVDISNQLLADSAGQAEAEVRLALSEDFAKKEAVAFLSGDGVLAPRGLLNHPDIGYVASGGASTMPASADTFIKMLYSLPAPYRNRGSWGMNGSVLAALRLFKDSTGQYLWRPSLAEGQPETFLGRPVVEMVDMPDVAANSFPIIFGDFSGYRILDRLAMSILVNPYVRATDGITRIHASRRVGGDVLEPAKFKKLKIAAS